MILGEIAKLVMILVVVEEIKVAAAAVAVAAVVAAVTAAVEVAPAVAIVSSVRFVPSMDTMPQFATTGTPIWARPMGLGLLQQMDHPLGHLSGLGQLRQLTCLGKLQVLSPFQVGLDRTGLGLTCGQCHHGLLIQRPISGPLLLTKVL